jgi:hypothetical protein
VKAEIKDLCFQPVGADSEANMTASSLTAPPLKHVFVRVKRKPFQSPLDAFRNPPFLFSSLSYFFSHSTIVLWFLHVAVLWKCRAGNHGEAIEASSLGFWKSINCQFFSKQYAAFLFVSIVLFYCLYISLVNKHVDFYVKQASSRDGTKYIRNGAVATLRMYEVILPHLMYIISAPVKLI